ncbi:ATP cone domain-containing protein [Clostridium weizhouense]|uniref:ATP-cone domain-containing protein n=1 Tax=Clostridium weizhouense TaxID=2859781 RepID=A0ABS7ART6_9CLOT|nr:ATP cone domain-containing protein [Clostridium weizhouense]MBW6410773.1 hypothetical protein [Clostridium weizhouense]
MNIIKKSGNIEEFEVSKIKRSILNASKQTQEALSDSELNLIEKEVIKILEKLKRSETSSYEIFSICLNVLVELGFNSIAKSYLDGSLNF